MKKIEFLDVHRCVEHMNNMYESGKLALSNVDGSEFHNPHKQEIIDTLIQSNEIFARTRELLIAMYSMIDNLDSENKESHGTCESNIML